MSAVRRSARRLLHARPGRERPGREPVRIDDLISPLRYDVIVRQRFLERIDGITADDRLRAAVETPEGRAYSAWFRGIAVPRFLPAIAADADAVDRAFAERVRRTAELSASVATSGYSPRQPIVLRSGHRIAATDTGKRIGHRLFAGDGCHRLALLRRGGTSVLEAGAYRVATAATLHPLDNTAPLISLLDLARPEYFEFLSLTYSPGDPCAGEAELRARVAERAPERLAELEGVLAVDLPLLAR